MDRLLSEQEVIKAVNKHTVPSVEIILSEDITAILKEVSSAEPKWIPIKTRPLTNKEKDEYADLGYSEDSISFMYDCPLPDDGEEVLITTQYGEVTTDTF